MTSIPPESYEPAGARRPQPPFPRQHLEKPGLESDLDPRPQYMGIGYKGSDKLADKVALITGGDSGIGRAVAVLFAREGADVAFTYLAEEESDADETLQAITAEGRRGIKIVCDVTNFKLCKAAVDAVVSRFGHLDILVNNAAFQQHIGSPEDLSLEQWDLTSRTNIYGYFHMVKASLEHLPMGGVIINTGSITGLEGSPNLLDYSSTKGAIHAFTKSLAKKLLERGIRVNCVAPGPVWTPLNPADQSADSVARFGQSTPMQRPAQPDEMAPTYVYLASNIDSSYVTGEIITLLGGETTSG
jgi:NAD(P)-dependent dehydrogenase (short-subunit alcohol dehydrogenase family)